MFKIKWLKRMVMAILSLLAIDITIALALTDEEINKAKRIYFDRCAGCHGTLRKGATGPEITDTKLKSKNYNTDIIKAFISNGTGGGMPGFVKTGLMTADEADLMARFVQVAPPVPPERSLADIEETWKLVIPVDKRPTKPMHKRSLDNLFGVVLRDAGKAAIIDGDTKELVSTVDIGFATHILRVSATGRYFYSIGRDGKAVLIDLWMEKPDKVAEVQACTEARSIDVSKYKGPKGNFLDKYAVIGCYWPPQFVILDGKTLKPLKVVSTRSFTYDTNEFVNEARVAAMIASHKDPEIILNVKEAGYIWFVDYSDLANLKISQVATERFLHDGGWDATKRYVMMAANMRNKMVIVDSQTKKQVAQIETGIKPHPGRGGNWTDPKYGPVSATPHLGEGLLTVWGSDPKGNPQHAWKVVRKYELLGGGSLFIKAHPKSKHVWADHTLNPEPKINRSLCVVDITKADDKPKCFEATDHGRIVHMEYNKNGDEMWVSVWDKQGEIIIYDDKTMKEKQRIKADWLVTPTGKFNVYNTMNDIY